MGHIRGARNIALDELLPGVAAVVPDPRHQVVLVDANDKLSHQAAAILQARGYTWVRVLRGGMRAWRAANLPVSVRGRQG